MQVNFKGNTKLILFIKIQAQQGDFPHTKKQDCTYQFTVNKQRKSIRLQVFFCC